MNNSIPFELEDIMVVRQYSLISLVFINSHILFLLPVASYAKAAGTTTPPVQQTPPRIEQKKQSQTQDDLTALKVEDRYVAANANYALCQRRVDTALADFKLKQESLHLLQEKAVIAKDSAREAKQKVAAEARIQNQAVFEEGRKKMEAAQDEIRHMHTWFASPEKVERIGQAKVMQSKLAGQNALASSDRIQAAQDRREWELDLQIQAANDEAKFAGIKVIGAKLKWLAATLDLLSSGLPVSSASELLASSKKQLSSELVEKFAKADNSGAAVAKEISGTALELSVNLESLLNSDNQSKELRAILEQDRQKKGDISACKYLPGMVTSGSEAKTELTTGLNQVIIAINGFEDAVATRRMTELTLPSTTLNRSQAIQARAEAIAEVVDAKSSLLSTKNETVK